MPEIKVDERKILEYHRQLFAIRKEISKVVVGQEGVVAALLLGLLANGHVLLEGIPGVAKTLLIRTLAQTTGCKFSRIQFTVDLLPTDITGITAYEPGRGFFVVKGPIFANFILADEVNRAPAKVQSALLEAMQEKQTTIGKETFVMMNPFFVMATENPIETSGSLSLDQEVFINGGLKRGLEIYDTIKGQEPIMSDGKINMYDIGDSWTFSLNSEGKLEKKRCYFYTLPYKDEVVCLKSSTGRTIRVTKNHPFLVNDNGILKWKKAQELSFNDSLVCVRKLPEIRQIKKQELSHLDSLKALGKKYNIIYYEDLLKLRDRSNNFSNFSLFNGEDFDKLRIFSNLRIKELYDALGFNDKKLYWQLKRFLRNDTNNSFIRKSLEAFFYKKDIKLNTPHDYIESYTITRLSRFEVDSDFIFWFSFLLSDGSINKGYVAAYQKNYPKALDKFIEVSENILGLKISEIRENPKGRSVIIRSKPLSDYLILRFNLKKDKNNFRTPSWLVSLPQELRRVFLKTFISLESSIDFMQRRINFIQKDRQTVNLISYMLLQEGFISYIKKRKDVYSLRLRVGDFSKYIENIGWFENDKIKHKLQAIEPGESKDSTMIPINREHILKLCSLLGINSFHTFKKRKKFLLRDWYIGYKAIKEGRNSISSKFLKLMLEDLEKEIKARESLNIDKFAEENPRNAAVLCGLSINQICKQTNFNKNSVWKLYSQGVCLKQEEIISYIKEQFKQRIALADQISIYLKELIKEELFYDKIKEIKYQDYDGLVFGLTVPDLQNYIGGFGCFGINHNTYPLPEAQIDRFLLKLFMGYPTKEDEQKVLNKNITLETFDHYNIKPIITPEIIVEMQETVKKIYMSPQIEKYIIDIVAATRQPKDYNIDLGKYIQWGGSPRASIGLFIASKANALLQGKNFVTPQHVKEVAYPVMRHRIILNYEGIADEVKTDRIISEILSKVPVP